MDLNKLAKAELQKVERELSKAKLVVESLSPRAQQLRAFLGALVVKKPNGKKTSANDPSKNWPSHCVKPNCKKAHNGPRFSFLCKDHSKATKPDKQKWLEAYRAR